MHLCFEFDSHGACLFSVLANIPLSLPLSPSLSLPLSLSLIILFVDHKMIHPHKSTATAVYTFSPNILIIYALSKHHSGIHSTTNSEAMDQF